MGQGLAGTVLALTLEERGFSVMLIDEPHRSACSKVAAGIWNPVVFKRLTKSWMADELLPVMLQFYRAQEKKLNGSLITERNIIKFFSEEQEITLWKKKSAGELKGYLDPEIYASGLSCIKTNLGYSKVFKAGSLDVKSFLDRARNYFLQKNAYREELFDHTALQAGNEIAYKSLSASKIIFAEGHLIRQNPYFGYIPLKPAKGEIMEIESKELETGTDVLNKNGFILPLVKSRFKVGATYNWSDLTDTPTLAGETELKNKFGSITTASFDVINRQAGVRPSVIDRRPVMGAHPGHKNIFVFNGMGTKGVMLAPYFAAHFADHLQQGLPLMKEVDVARFGAGLNLSRPYIDE